MEEISNMLLKSLYPQNMTEGFAKFVLDLKNKDSSLAEILDELFYRFFGISEDQAIFEKLKPYILMKAYAYFRYYTLRPINKSDVEKAYSESLGFEKGHFTDDFKNYRKLIRKDMEKTKWSFPDKKAACYLSQFWTKYVKPVCYDALDMAYYIRHYKRWLFYPDNRYGMTFYHYYNSMYDIFSHEGNNTATSHTFKKDFSAFIFEEIFSSQSLMSTALSFSKHFSKWFSDINTGKREQTMVLFLPISFLPHDIRALYEPYYIDLIRKWGESKLDSVLDEIIQTYASMMSLVDYYIPLLEISFILAISEKYKYEGNGSAEAKNICKDLEQAYIAKNP